MDGTKNGRSRGPCDFLLRVSLCQMSRFVCVCVFHDFKKQEFSCYRDLSSVFLFGASSIPAGVSACHLKRLPRRVKSEHSSIRPFRPFFHFFPPPPKKKKKNIINSQNTVDGRTPAFSTSQWIQHIEIPHVF